MSGAQRTLQYDALSRLQVLTQDFSATDADVRTSFSFNAASQVRLHSVSNAVYVYDGDENIRGSYAVNGLNQYTGAGSADLLYSNNGNLSHDGDSSYSYDVENRLRIVSGARNGTLHYDPLGRLYKVVSDGQTRRFLYDGDALVAEYDGRLPGRSRRRAVKFTTTTATTMLLTGDTLPQISGKSVLLLYMTAPLL